MPDKTDKYTICLVACSSSKRVKLSRAEDLYTGALFQHSRRWAERFADSWYVLSAKHGFLYPHEEISPYDESLTSKDRTERNFWGRAVTNSLLIQVDPPIGATVVLLAGEVYADPILRYLTERRRDLVIERPLEHLRIGEQVSWLIAQTQEGGTDAK